MAQKVVRELVDDIDGSPAERTIAFAVDGTTYEIDLSRENLAEFQAAIAGYIESARKVGPASKHRRLNGASTSDLRRQRERMNEVRQWARANGYTVSARGRISAEVLTAFGNRGSITATAAG